MKLRMKRTQWQFGPGGFSCKLVLGQREGKHGEQFIPVASGVPLGEYSLTSESDGTTGSPDLCQNPGGRTARMPKEGEFQVVKTSKEGREVILVRPGSDNTDRVLLFIGDCSARGDVRIYEPGTTGTVLAVCKAENEKEGRIEVAVILSPGQTIAFNRRSEHYCTDNVAIYGWDGTKVQLVTLATRKEWELRQSTDQLAGGKVEVM